MRQVHEQFTGRMNENSKYDQGTQIVNEELNKIGAMNIQERQQASSCAGKTIKKHNSEFNESTGSASIMLAIINSNRIFDRNPKPSLPSKADTIRLTNEFQDSPSSVSKPKHSTISKKEQVRN